MLRRFSGFTLCALGCQFFFGGWFLFHGLNYWTHFYDDPTIRPGPGLLPALEASGLLAVVKALEVLIAVAMLSDRFVPLAAVMAAPISVVIAYVNSSHHRLFGVCVGIIILLLNSMIALGHFGCFVPLLTANAGLPVAPTARTRPAAGAATSLSVPVQVTAIALGIACAAAITFATLPRR